MPNTQQIRRQKLFVMNLELYGKICQLTLSLNIMDSDTLNKVCKEQNLVNNLLHYNIPLQNQHIRKKGLAAGMVNASKKNTN